MSRIGNAIINIADDANLSVSGKTITIKGPKGEAIFTLPPGLSVDLEGKTLKVICEKKDKSTQALHGFARATLANHITGVTTGWTKTLELSGVGFRATLNGANLVLNIGFSHPVTVVPQAGISFQVVEGKIVVLGIDKQLVGMVASQIREIKKPEPYKGKGIKYQGEKIRKKAGKAKAVGAAGGK